MDGVEGPQFGRGESSRDPHDGLVQAYECDSGYDGPAPPDRSTADPSCHSFNLDPSHHARNPLRPGSQELAKSFRLGLGYHKFHDGRGVEVQKPSGQELCAIFAELPKGIGPLGADRPFQRSKVEEVSFWRRGPSRSHQLPEGGAGLVHRTEHRHRFAALGHLEALTPRHPAQIQGEVLAELSDAHSVSSHVYTHCSIFGQLPAALRRQLNFRAGEHCSRGAARGGLRRFVVSCPIPSAVSDPADLDEDTRFLQEQARRYLAARPWERFSGRAVYMALKAGSWYQVCAQTFDNAGGRHILLVFPGWRDMRDLQRAGSAQPPPLTVMAELADPVSTFQMADDDGWLPIDRFSGRLLALAFAAIIDLNAAGSPPDTEISGELRLPGKVRGRYRAVLKPADSEDDRLMPVMSKVRMDLLQEGDSTLTFMNLSWETYRALSKRTQLCVPSPEPFEDRGQSIPVVVVSDPIERAWTVADKLHAAEPLGLAFVPMAAQVGLVVVGPKDGYCLTILNEEAAAVRAWWKASTDGSGGAVALIVVDTTPDPDRFDRWVPTNVLAVFEFGSQKPSSSEAR